MVGDTQLIKALPDGGLRRLGHGLVSVRGTGGMYVIIGKVHGLLLLSEKAAVLFVVALAQSLAEPLQGFLLLPGSGPGASQ